MEITVERLVNELKNVIPEDRVVINTTVRELQDRKSTRLNSSHTRPSRMPSSA